MNPKIKYSELLSEASRAFLTDPVPKNWLDLSEKQQDQYIEDHVWEPLENKETRYVIAQIEKQADNLDIFLTNKAIKIIDE